MEIQEIMGWLREVEHPAKGDKNIVELEMIENIETGEDRIS